MKKVIKIIKGSYSYKRKFFIKVIILIKIIFRIFKTIFHELKNKS